MIKKRIPVIILAVFSLLFISQAVLAELCNLVFFIMGWATNSDYFSYRGDVAQNLCELLVILAIIALFCLVLVISIASVKWKHLSLALIPFWLIAPLYYVLRGMITRGHYVVYLGYYWNYYYRGYTETWYGWFNLLMLLMFFTLGFLCLVASIAAGITAIGARFPLVAFNVNLDTDDVSIAKTIAKTIRASGGGFRSCKAIGLKLEDRNIAQVSMNMVNSEGTPLYYTYEMIRTLADRYGVRIIGSELVGITPAKALIDCAEFYLKLENFNCREQVMEYSLLDMME